MIFNSDTYYKKSKERIHLYDNQRRKSNPIEGNTMPKLSSLSIGEARKFSLSVLSVDLIGFTALSMKLDNPKIDVLRRIQSIYLTEMTYIINDYNGVTEKYTGDGILGLFGTEKSEDLTKAVQNSVDCCCTIKAVFKHMLNPYFISNSLEEINYRIGIDCGPVIIERVGMKNNNQISLSGPTVNLSVKLSKISGENECYIGNDVYSFLNENEQNNCTKLQRKWDYKYSYYKYNGTWKDQ